MFRRIMQGVMFFIILSVISLDEANAKQGFNLGLDLRYDKITGSDFSDEFSDGVGLSLRAGYGFTPSWSLQFSLLGDSAHDGDITFFNEEGEEHFSSLNFGGIVLDMLYNFQTEQSLQPYVLFGLGLYGLGGDSDNGFGGLGLNLGVGANYYATSNLSVDFGLTQRFIQYDKLMIDGTTYSLSDEADGSTLSIYTGATYHF